ncbi:hypothetical protein GGR57DRAFT_149266 [Xylariaceae sp. FL1272]|nr:hypothetical protein GGR57DRAFT_149266 [Xylariaceae sp. FL1272]
MAEPSGVETSSRQWPPAMLDLQRRAHETPSVGFQAFDTFPWVKDQMFKSNLMRLLYTMTPDGLELAAAALRTRVERFAQQTGIVIDTVAYLSWHQETKNPQPRLFSEQDILREQQSNPIPGQRRLAILHSQLGYSQVEDSTPASGQTSDAEVPSWQKSAPTAQLYVPKDKGPLNPDKEPYPKKFQDIFEFLESGKEIPGIRKIPDTVIEDPAIKTQGSRTAPLKPWERRTGDTNLDAKRPLESAGTEA